MFGKLPPTTPSTVQATQATPMIEHPAPALVTSVPLDDNELRAYTRTAQAVGFLPAALLEAQLLAFFAEHKIPRYDYVAVSRYLTKKAEQDSDRKVWFWRPLREKDTPKGWEWGRQRQDEQWQNDWYRAQWMCRPYHRAVPLRVLAMVEEIGAAFPEALFFVTDMMTPKQILATRPDPFICVTALDVARLVFDCWDEPGFSG